MHHVQAAHALMQVCNASGHDQLFCTWLQECAGAFVAQPDCCKVLAGNIIRDVATQLSIAMEAGHDAKLLPLVSADAFSLSKGMLAGPGQKLPASISHPVHCPRLPTSSLALV